MQAFTDPMTEVYLLFFQATIPTFTDFNLLLQREQSAIYLLHDEVGLDLAVFFHSMFLAVCAGIQLGPRGNRTEHWPLQLKLKGPVLGAICPTTQRVVGQIIYQNVCLHRDRCAIDFLKIIQIKSRKTAKNVP